MSDAASTTIAVESDEAAKDGAASRIKLQSKGHAAQPQHRPQQNQQQPDLASQQEAVYRYVINQDEENERRANELDSKALAPKRKQTKRKAQAPTKVSVAVQSERRGDRRNDARRIHAQTTHAPSPLVPQTKDAVLRTAAEPQKRSGKPIRVVGSSIRASTTPSSSSSASPTVSPSRGGGASGPKNVRRIPAQTNTPTAARAIGATRQQVPQFRRRQDWEQKRDIGHSRSAGNTINPAVAPAIASSAAPSTFNGAQANSNRSGQSFRQRLQEKQSIGSNNRPGHGAGARVLVSGARASAPLKITGAAAGNRPLHLHQSRARENKNTAEQGNNLQDGTRTLERARQFNASQERKRTFGSNHGQSARTIEPQPVNGSIGSSSNAPASTALPEKVNSSHDQGAPEVHAYAVEDDEGTASRQLHTIEDGPNAQHEHEHGPEVLSSYPISHEGHEGRGSTQTATNDRAQHEHQNETVYATQQGQQNDASAETIIEEARVHLVDDAGGDTSGDRELVDAQVVVEENKGSNGKLVLIIGIGCMITVVIVVVAVSVTVIQVFGGDGQGGATTAASPAPSTAALLPLRDDGFEASATSSQAPAGATPIAVEANHTAFTLLPTPSPSHSDSSIPSTAFTLLPTPSPSHSDGSIPGTIVPSATSTCVPGWYYYTYQSGTQREIGRVNVGRPFGSHEYVATSDCNLWPLAFDDTGAAFGLCLDSFVRVDLSTGSTSKVYSFEHPGSLSTLAYSPFHRHFYTLLTNWYNDTITLLMIKEYKAAGWNATATVDFHNSYSYDALAIDSNGNAFGIDNFNELYSVNLTTGAPLRIRVDVDDLGSLAFDGENTLYAIAYSHAYNDPSPLLVIRVSGTSASADVAIENTFADRAYGGAICPL